MYAVDEEILEMLHEKGLLSDIEEAQKLVDEMMSKRIIIDWTPEDVKQAAKDMISDMDMYGRQPEGKREDYERIVNEESIQIEILKTIEVDDDRGVSFSDIEEAINLYVEATNEYEEDGENNE
ncbi:MAG: hypothetical protein WCZ66_12135 [Sphingomonadaceae bacterium]